MCEEWGAYGIVKSRVSLLVYVKSDMVMLVSSVVWYKCSLLFLFIQLKHGAHGGEAEIQTFWLRQIIHRLHNNKTRLIYRQ